MMPGKTALINYKKCVPAECRNGICNAIATCSKKVIKQEMPFEAPFINSYLCIGCFKCLPACLRGAIEKAK